MPSAAFFNNIKAQLETIIFDGSAIQFIQMWNNQLESLKAKDTEANIMYSFTLPALFVEFLNLETEQLGNGNQVYANLTVRIHILHRLEVQSIIMSYPGWWKEYPLVGCAAPNYLNSPGVGQQLSNSINQQLKLDGKTLTSFSASINADGTLTINVNGQSIEVAG